MKDHWGKRVNAPLVPPFMWLFYKECVYDVIQEQKASVSAAAPRRASAVRSNVCAPRLTWFAVHIASVRARVGARTCKHELL